MKKINPFLWFESETEEAAKFHVAALEKAAKG
jgi:predicted 3-demethylubiquinone-9 3-methyltransferase (glyoxalase superfamily)